MKTVNDIFDAALGLMDELTDRGTPSGGDRGEYARRTPGIVNMMLAEYRLLAGARGGFVTAAALEDPVAVDDAYALGPMGYGLAANLLADENPALASFFQQRYEELRNIHFSRRRAEPGEAVQDLYGGIEFGKFGHW